jgi:hypothetical protein
VLLQALQMRLEDEADFLLKEEVDSSSMTNVLATKLDSLSKILKLDPYNRLEAFERKHKPIDENDIAPVHIVCPMTMECETDQCQSCAIHRYT